MFDLSTIDAAAGAEAGAAMTILHPATKKPVLDESSQPVTITLLGMRSKAADDITRRQIDRRLDSERKGNFTDIATIEANTIERLALLTKAWSFDKLDGQDFPCTFENAKKLYGDYRFAFIRSQANTFVDDDANFMGVAI